MILLRKKGPQVSVFKENKGAHCCLSVWRAALVTVGENFQAKNAYITFCSVNISKCCNLCWWAAAAATIFILLAVKITCKWCEPWQHHAICLLVKIVRGPHRAEH